MRDKIVNAKDITNELESRVQCVHMEVSDVLLDPTLSAKIHQVTPANIYRKVSLYANLP